MTVYVLLCFYDLKCEVWEVYYNQADALAEALRMEQNNEVEPGNWLVSPRTIR